MSFQNLVGQTLGQYELRELLGAGGMGAVYLGFQPSLNRKVAVKVLLTHLISEEGYIERFNREAQIAAALEHPHIVPVVDFGTQRGINYVVMRLLRGGTLAERVRQRQATNRQLLSLGEISDLLKQVASALDYAHSRGVVHRDIKPSNIMFDDQGTAFLVDFGIAKPLDAAQADLTLRGTSMGTAAYMSPEQWRGEQLTPSIDQYAMGLVIYTLVTGRPAFEVPPETPYALMHKHINEMPAPAHTMRHETPEAVSAAIERAIAKLPEDRYPTISDFAKRFERAIQGAAGRTTGFFTFTLPKNPVAIAAGQLPRSPNPTPTPPSAPIRHGGRVSQPPYGGADAQLEPISKPHLGMAPQSPAANRLPLILGVVAVLIVLVLGALIILGSSGGGASPQIQITAAMLAQTQTKLAELMRGAATSAPVAAATLDQTAAALIGTVYAPTQGSGGIIILPTNTSVLTPTPMPTVTQTLTRTPTATSTIDKQATTQAIVAATATGVAQQLQATQTAQQQMTAVVLTANARMTMIALTATKTPTGTPTFTPTASPTQTHTPTPASTLTPTPLGGGNGKIVFVSDASGNANVYIVNSDGSGMVNLTKHSVEDFTPNISPDGRKIIFASGAGSNLRLFVMNTDGSSSATLPIDVGLKVINRPVWSPDGRKIAFHAIPATGSKFQVFVANGDGSNLTQLTKDEFDNRRPFWSSDGKRIVFFSNRDGNNEIYVMNTDGSNLTRLTNNAADDARPMWSPRGDKIAFYSNRDGIGGIYVMNVDGSSQKRLTPLDSNERDEPVWSPDGTQILYTTRIDGKTKLYLMGADGSSPHVLASTGGSNEFHPDWR